MEQREEVRVCCGYEEVMLDSVTLPLWTLLIWAFVVDCDFVKVWRYSRFAGFDASEPLIMSEMARLLEEESTWQAKWSRYSCCSS